MAVSLSQATVAERDERVTYNALPPAATIKVDSLARECARVARHAGGSLATEDERDALAQMLAVWSLERMNAGDALTRPLLRHRAVTLLRDSREWRDVAGTYETRRREDRPTPYVRIDTTGDVAAMDRASDHAGDESAPLPSDLRDLAQTVARWAMGGRTGGDVQARYVEAALLARWVAVPLEALAADQDRTVKAVRRDVEKGAAILLATFTARQLARLVHAASLTLRDDSPDVIAWAMRGPQPAGDRATLEADPRVSDGRDHPCHAPRTARKPNGATGRDVCRYMRALEARATEERGRVLERAAKGAAARWGKAALVVP